MFKMINGILQKNEGGRYDLIDQDGNVNTYFTSGDLIEIYNGDKWIKGRIEYDHDFNDYYFYNSSGRHIRLYDGMKARI